jgi:3-oxoacyl-[acyl-carrier-protein] synthase-1
MVAILATGLVTSVGNGAATTCAAIRANVTNPTTTRFCAGHGDWIIGHQAEVAAGLRGADKLAVMAALAIADCLDTAGIDVARPMALFLCLAELDRPGRLVGVDETLIPLIEARLGMRFDRMRSRVIAAGRIGALAALAAAREVLRQPDVPHVLVAATDSLLVAGTLAALRKQERILTPENSNGFMPGEGAGAILVALADDATHGCPEVLGFGEGHEHSPIISEEPLRGSGLSAAISAALFDGGAVRFESVDVRICDASGEQYGFKEAALAVGRLLRARRPNQDIWHPAEVVGEIGSAIGPVMVAIASSGLRKGLLGPGPVLIHAGTDEGRRVACVMRLREARRPGALRFT